MKDTATLLAAHPARLQHISRSHAALGLPVLVPICLGGTVPACTSVSPWPDTEGLTQAGSKTLQMTPALQEAGLCGSADAAHPFHQVSPVDRRAPAPRSKAEQDKGQPFTATPGRHQKETEACEIPCCHHNAWHRKGLPFLRSIYRTRFSGHPLVKQMQNATICSWWLCKMQRNGGKNARMGERSPSGPKGNTQLYHTKEDVRGAVGRAARVGAAHSHVQA